MKRCNFTHSLKRGEQPEPQLFILVRDNCLIAGGPSVTNAAEAVCAEMVALYGDHRIVYCDTEGHWDELVHHRGAFADFRPLTPETRTALEGLLT
jgi:hypothetical protein